MKPSVRAWLNRLEFSGERRLFFLTRISAMNGAGIALRSIFESLVRFPGSAAEKKLSQYSLSNITTGRPFAEGYDKHGWFDTRSTALLVTGEERQCLARTLERLVRDPRTTLSFWRLVFVTNLRWFLSAMIALAICVVLYTQQHLFVQVLGAPQGGGQQMVFGIGLVLWEYGIHLATLVALLAMWFYYRLYHHIGPARDQKDRRGIYRLFRRQFVLRLLPELSNLMNTGLSPVDALELCLTIYTRGYYRYRLTDLSVAMATGGEMIDLLGERLLEQRYAVLAASIAEAYPGEPQRVLSDIHRIMYTDTENQYRALSRRLCFVLMIVLLMIIYGVLDVIYAAPVTFH